MSPSPPPGKPHPRGSCQLGSCSPRAQGSFEQQGTLQSDHPGPRGDPLHWQHSYGVDFRDRSVCVCSNMSHDCFNVASLVVCVLHLWVHSSRKLQAPVQPCLEPRKGWAHVKRRIRQTHSLLPGMRVTGHAVSSGDVGWRAALGTDDVVTYC